MKVKAKMKAILKVKVSKKVVVVVKVKVGAEKIQRIKKSEIIQQIVTDMAKAAVESVEADESDSVVKKSNINIPDDVNLLITKPQTLDNKLSVSRNQTDSFAKKQLVQQQVIVQIIGQSIGVSGKIRRFAKSSKSKVADVGT